MKRILLFTITLSILMSAIQLNAQSVIALHQSGNVLLFSDFVQAYQAANSGDTIYMPGGVFLAPDTISKTIYVFGSGHNPSHTVATQSTVISGEIKFFEGADNSYFEGIHFPGQIIFLHNQSVNDVTFRRCRINGRLYYYGTSPYSNPSSNTMFLECIFTSTDYSYFYNATNQKFRNCIFQGNYMTNLKNSLIENCIGLSVNNLLFNSTDNVIRNNVLKNNSLGSSSSGNIISNNVCLNSFSIPGTNDAFDNLFEVGEEGFFVSYAGGLFSYDDDYNLQVPESYLGSDGKQVGIYGGMVPFKDGSVPFLPYIKSKNISLSTDEQGNLQIGIEVEAQEY